MSKMVEKESPVSLVPVDGNCPQIKYGDAFEEWDDARKIRYLKALASSMNNAADLIQKERNKLIEQLDWYKTQLDNAEKALSIQKQVVSDQLTTSNAQVQSYAKIIQDLQSELRESRQTVNDLSGVLRTTES